MLLSEFTKYIPKILKERLPAAAAHIKMAPAERVAAMDPLFYEKSNARKSAVMMLFYPKNGEAHLVLIKRNAYPGIHSSQISFPGGKEEPEDTSLAETALRETFEEIGIVPYQINVIMPFTQVYIPPSNFLVIPFLGIAENELHFNPNPAEVAEVIEVPLAVFLDDSSVIATEVQTSYMQTINTPAFRLGGHIVWGATAMMLSELKETVKSAIK